jgi:peptidoglycan L-alanyl-D-glutamate endopeptidase CwlK
MPVFGPESLRQRATLHPRLQLVLDEAIKYFDFSIIEGFRGKEAQNAAYAKHLSQLPWPLGNHNKSPSTAADIAPYPVDWKEGEKPHLRFAFMMGVVYMAAKKVGVKVRFGMDWNRNLDMRDEGFIDMPHVELDE